MNPPYNNVFRKVESAFATYLTATLTAPQLDGATIHLGRSNDTITVPHIYCHFRVEKENERRTGNFDGEAEIGVKSHAADETTLEGSERFGAVLDAIMVDTLEDSLMSAQSGLTVFGIGEILPESEIDGNCFVERVRIKMMVCGSAL